MSQERKEQVFLSYAHEDLETVRKVYEGLTKRGLKVWFDKEKKKIGPWKRRILKEISRSRYFVLCLSGAALRKTGDEPGFQDEELDYAYDIAMKQSLMQFTIVPLRLEDCGRGDNRLSTFQQYDLFEDFEGCLDELAVEFGGRSLSDSTAKDERPEPQKIIDALLGKATMAYYAKDYSKTLVLIDTIIEIDPQNSWAWSNKGVVLSASGKNEAAISCYDKAIKLNPQYAPAWNNKGTVLSALGKKEEAISCYDNAIKFAPQYAPAWNNKGNALYALGKKEDAIFCYDTAIKFNPQYTKAWNNKGVVLSASGKNEDAKAAFKRALELDPSLSPPKFIIDKP